MLLALAIFLECAPTSPHAHQLVAEALTIARLTRHHRELAVRRGARTLALAAASSFGAGVLQASAEVREWAQWAQEELAGQRESDEESYVMVAGFLKQLYEKLEDE